MFKQGTDATMTLPDGTKKPLGNLQVRASEYTVGTAGDNAMPGELPTSSAYTYATEFSVDQAVQARATDVTFDKPVATYVDDFLDFRAGTRVPAAYYDEAKSAWVPSTNGVVLKILAIVGGQAQIDVTGDGVADTGAPLDKWGITTDELKQLGSRYAVGKTLWRVAVKHFTPWDYNWPYGCKVNCPPPKEPPPPPPYCPECEAAGSIVGLFNQTLGESVHLVGTPFELDYQTDRSPGYKEAYTIRVPLSGRDHLEPAAHRSPDHGRRTRVHAELRARVQPEVHVHLGRQRRIRPGGAGRADRARSHRLRVPGGLSRTG